MAGRTDDAIDLALKSRHLYPERGALMALWLAEVHQRLRDDRAAALRELTRALARGHWWSESLLRAQPFLLPLADDPDFEALVVQAELMRRDAQGRRDSRGAGGVPTDG